MFLEKFLMNYEDFNFLLKGFKREKNCMMYDMNKLIGLRWWIDMYIEDIDKVYIIIIEKFYYCVFRILVRVCNKDIDLLI